MQAVNEGFYLKADEKSDLKKVVSSFTASVEEICSPKILIPAVEIQEIPSTVSPVAIQAAISLPTRFCDILNPVGDVSNKNGVKES
jgi:hypothetical protein